MNYDYDRHANFSAYRTYAWAGGTNLADDRTTPASSRPWIASWRQRG